MIAAIKINKVLFALAPVLMAGFMMPENHKIPVAGAGAADWNPNSFRYNSWGRSETHNGIDIFAREGVPVLGAKWRFYCYAHLRLINILPWQWLNAGDVIGTVGNTGDKPEHLYFSIRSLYPLPRLCDSAKPSAWSRMFHLNPNEFLTGADAR